MATETESTKETKPEEKKTSKFEKASEGQSSSLVGDTIGFLKQNKKWWLLPIMSTLLLISVLLLLSGTAIAPFIYTLF
jgi:hypothetical protein